MDVQHDCGLYMENETKDVTLAAITYAALIWCHEVKTEGRIGKLSKLERLRCLWITESLATTLTAVFEVPLDLPPFHPEEEAQANFKL